MGAGSLLWLSAAVLVFVVANSILRAYAASAQLPVLLGALALFCMGNIMMVRLMRESGLAVAAALSAVIQLVLLAVVAVVWFGEKPTPMQLTGIGLGLVAVALIAWPQEISR